MQTATTTPPPAMPYAVEELAFGTTGRTRPAKVPPGGRPVEYLTDDEIAVWQYVRHLERDNERLRAELQVLPPPAPPEVMNIAIVQDVAGAHHPGGELEPGTAHPNVELEPEEVAPAPAGFVAVEAVAAAGVAAGVVPAEPADVGEPGARTPLQAAIAAVLKMNPSYSNGRIAEPLGASGEMVRKVRKQLEAAGELQPVDAVVGRDGQEQAVPRSTVDAA